MRFEDLLPRTICFVLGIEVIERHPCKPLGDLHDRIGLALAEKHRHESGTLFRMFALAQARIIEMRVIHSLVTLKCFLPFYFFEALA